MLIVTHELQALHDVLTRIIQLNGGRISFDGAPVHRRRHQHDRDHDHDHDGQHDGQQGLQHDGHHDEDEVPAASSAAGPFDPTPGRHHA
jgi:ABC-type multidrug transport system ATPase subunit